MFERQRGVIGRRDSGAIILNLDQIKPLILEAYV